MTFTRTAALRTIIFDQAFDPDIAVFLDLQALIRVRRLAKESRFCDRQLKVEIAAEMQNEVNRGFPKTAAYIFQSRHPGLTWERLVAGRYPDMWWIPPPGYWQSEAYLWQRTRVYPEQLQRRWRQCTFSTVRESSPPSSP